MGRFSKSQGFEISCLKKVQKVRYKRLGDGIKADPAQVVTIARNPQRMGIVIS